MLHRAIHHFIRGATTGGVVASVYMLAVRPWHMRWGATDAEVAETLPGDELLPDAQVVSTRAITIQASAADAWPWIAQLGEGRGGFYSYTWVENLLGCRMQNADRVIPEFQDPHVGDRIWLARWWNERYDAPSYLIVAAVEPDRIFTLQSPTAEGESTTFSWAFVLREQGEGRTRLLVRSRSRWVTGLRGELFSRAIGEPAHFVMERKMMLGIQQRAEALASTNRSDDAAGEEPV
jgi:hypothetical protein